MEMKFPRTIVGGLSLPRMLIGTNWIFGYSHTSPAADSFILDIHSRKDSMVPMIRTFLDHGIDAIMGPFSTTPQAADKLAHVQDAVGKKLILIDTPVINVDDSAEARRETQAIIRKSADMGASFCLIHHASCEQLINKNRKTMDRIGDYLEMIREAGLRPGLSAHMPEVIQYSDLNEYDVETYIQIFNCAGFLMQIEIESVIKIIHEAKKPVMTIKPMAAGRVSPYVGLTFNWSVLRDIDMVSVGCLSQYEAEEDIEISLAALERRLPRLEGRSSPAKQSIIK
ncbi:hypothetical protein LJC14_06415 [Treponema sp. OttesenSCG-928-L16]|nr:hypothetical protein [Treponema sp. OttesenSCG-928-L16]